MVKESGNEMRDGFNKVFEHIGAALGTGAMIARLEKTFSSVKQIKAAAESIGVSTSFIQDLENVGKVAGLDAERVEKLMQKFVKGLPQGSDVETAFMNMATKLAMIEDPATRAQEAIKAFGKSGIDVIKIVEGGAEGIRKMAAEFAKFSDTDIKAIEEAHLEMEKLDNRLSVYMGKAVSWIGLVARAAGSLSTKSFGAMTAPGALGKEMGRLGSEEQAEAGRKDALRKTAEVKAAQAKASKDAADALEKYNTHLDDLKVRAGTTAEKLGILNKRLEEQKAIADTADSDAEHFSALTNIADIEEKIAEVKKEAQKKQEEASQKEKAAKVQILEKEQAITRHAEARDKLGRNYVNTLDDRSKYSLGELADRSRQKWERGGRGTWAERTAVDIENIEARAKEARNFNNPKFADALTDQALNLRKSIGYTLKSDDADPMKDLRISFEKSEQSLADLLNLASTKGFNINNP